MFRRNLNGRRAAFSFRGRKDSSAAAFTAALAAFSVAAAVFSPSLPVFAGSSTAFANTGSNGAAEETAAESSTGAAEQTAPEINAGAAQSTAAGKKEVTLRICNWEEYIDEGGWGEDEKIDLPSGDVFGDQSMIEDFEEWYEKTYGVRVHVEYSTFGTNEDLYNMLSLGDTYDLVCPSEYMFMKLISEDQVVPLSDHFFDTSDENNYYIKGVSPYLKNIFDTHEIDGKPWSKYAAGYMWGVTGIVYNPELVSRKEASTWQILTNPAFKRRITIKDSVRECYFAAIGALEHDKLTSSAFLQDPQYRTHLEEELNNTTPEMIGRVQDWLQDMKNNVYSFEVDSGKADMVTGKVAANYQWSGDAVYTMDQADEDNFTLDFAIPEEASNIYFDGWVMLKNGIRGDADRQQAAEAFINFISRPDNAIRNMYYIGYTSFISGGEDPRILEYIDWNYGADEDEKDTAGYNLTYFFTGDDGETDPDYVLTVPEKQVNRQLGAQYPSVENIRRTCIMRYFDKQQNADINRMWVNVRCYNIKKLPVWGWCLCAAGAAAFLAMLVLRIRKSLRAKAQ